MSRCKSCAAEIRWERTITGSRIPLDSEPNPEGNIVLADGMAVVVDNQGSLLDDGDSYQGDRFVTHFVTCPNANEHRRVHS